MGWERAAMVSTAAAEKARVINSGVIAEASRPLDLGLQAAHSFRARLTPVSKVSPGQTGPLQLRAVGAAEAHVVRSRVVPGGHGCLHAKRESHQEAAAGTPQRLTPRAPPARKAETRGLRGRPHPPPAGPRPRGFPVRCSSHLTSTEVRSWESPTRFPGLNLPTALEEPAYR